jgi:dipeptidyl-peptidase-4
MSMLRPARWPSGEAEDRSVISIEERYERAERVVDPLSLIRNRTVAPVWLGEGDAFRYQRVNEDGDTETIEVDPAAAATWTVATADDPESVGSAPGALVSPNGRVEVFARGHDVWARTTADGVERPVTTGGEPGFAWGALPDNCQVRIPMRRSGVITPPSLTGFSPSGDKLITARVDERAAAEWPFVEHVPEGRARPVVHGIRVFLDDETSTRAREVLLHDFATGTSVQLDLPFQALETLIKVGVDQLVWDAEETRFWVLAHGLGEKTASLLEVDVREGRVREVVRETADAVYESNQFLYCLPLVRVVPERNAVIWFSQRDGWGHLYQYTLDTGEHVRPISHGPLVVRDILRVNPDDGSVLFVAGATEPGRNPYWRALYRGWLDGRPMELLTPEACDHEFAERNPAFFTLVFNGAQVEPVSPSGRYVIDHMSTVDSPPLIVLRDLGEGGRVVLELEQADDSALLATGYRRPVNFTVKAEDGVSELWGVLTLPATPVDPDSIPVIDLIYAGFQTTWQYGGYLGPAVAARSTTPSVAYGELGFATVIVDGRGTPGRHRDFRLFTHNQPDPARGLADHVWAIRGLAEQYPQLDLERVGVTGFSYGGYNSARCMLLFPDFYKVGVSGAGVHVPEKMPHGHWSWFIGADGNKAGDTYRSLGNLHLADRLQGRLMLSYGDMDENATPDHTLALIKALIDAGKRVDVKVWPGGSHYTQMGRMMLFNAWDYFVTHLLGATAPGNA